MARLFGHPLLSAIALSVVNKNTDKAVSEISIKNERHFLQVSF